MNFCLNVNYFLVALFSCLALTNCSHYYDTSSKIVSEPIMDGSMKSYPDSNVLIFRSHMTFHADTESWHPKAFYIRIPKRLKSYDFNYLTSFVFYYSDDQALAIWVDPESTWSGQDTTYEPTYEEIDRFVAGKLIVSAKQYNIQKMPFLENRRHLIMKTKGATILLYNIKKDRFNGFVHEASSFKFL